MVLLYFVFGPKLENHQMVQFSFLSFLSQKGCADGKAMMHKDEGHPSTMMTKTLRMWKTIKGHTYSSIEAYTFSI